MMNENIDWMGLWYKIIKARGENDLPTFGLLNLESNQVEWMNFSHSEMDGIGAMIAYYENTPNPIINYPKLRETLPPSFFETILIFARLIFKRPNIKAQWLETNIGLEPINPRKIEYFIFSSDETQIMENYCKTKKFSVNAFLIDQSSKFLLSRLSKIQSGTWTIPVNLRPILSLPNIKANHSSGILINVSEKDNALKIHQTIIAQLKNKQHWGIWWIHQIGRIIGIRGMTYLSNKTAKKNFIIGSFSNLGSWDLPKNQIWVGSPPGSKNFPISIMAMKANQRLSLSLKIHPFILKNQMYTSELLLQLVAQIREEIAIK